MDTLGGLLDSPRARGAFALRAVMSAPWSLRDLANSPLTLIAGVEGKLWVIPDDSDSFQIGPGDIAVIRTPVHYTLADAPATIPQVIIHPGQRCCDLEGNPLHDTMMHGVRTWGNDAEGSTLFLVGAYEHLSDISDRLLRALPPVLSLTHDDWASPLVGLLCDEVIKDEPGQAAVLDRLLDLLVTAGLQNRSQIVPSGGATRVTVLSSVHCTSCMIILQITGRWRVLPQNRVHHVRHWRGVSRSWWVKLP